MSGTSVSSPEEWFRAALKETSPALRLFVVWAQRLLLGLRLELRPSPEYLLEWKIAARGESWLRLEASSWLLSGHVVLHAEEGRRSLAAFVRYEHRVAALVWPAVSLIHRRVALALVSSAARVA